MKLRDEKRGDPTATQSLLIDRHDGSPIPLGQLAQVEETFGPSSIRRESGSRRIAVEAKVHERDLGSTAREIQERVAREVSMPTGYFFDVGGRVESRARASHALSVAIGIALVSVFLLLYLALGSFSDAAVILGTLPVAFVGGILALMIAGETWNVSSLVGLIGLFGIAMQNGLVDYTDTVASRRRQAIRRRRQRGEHRNIISVSTIGAKCHGLRGSLGKDHKEKAPDAVSWYRPNLETSLALIKRLPPE